MRSVRAAARALGRNLTYEYADQTRLANACLEEGCPREYCGEVCARADAKTLAFR